MPNKVSLYANVGPELTHYDVDAAAATLTRRATVSLPANVQYAWPHASRRFLYVATSDSASGMGAAGNQHHVTALAVDPATGTLSPHGEPIRLPTRPIHMATDIPSQFVLVAFNNPSALRVYRINPDATPGDEVAQSELIDPGIFAHQVRATPDNRQVILVTRGHDAADGKPEEPGALQVFDFSNG
ncbi:MAG TPA: beta-propeller fold lactonase family protein, partial [Acetobacteraceae bacterium]